MFFKFNCDEKTVCTYIDIGQIILDESNAEIRICKKDSTYAISITSFSKGREVVAFNNICKAISEEKHYFDIAEYQGE